MLLSADQNSMWLAEQALRPYGLWLFVCAYILGLPATCIHAQFVYFLKPNNTVYQVFRLKRQLEESGREMEHVAAAAAEDGARGWRTCAGLDNGLCLAPAGFAAVQRGGPAAVLHGPRLARQCEAGCERSAQRAVRVQSGTRGRGRGLVSGPPSTHDCQTSGPAGDVTHAMPCHKTRRRIARTSDPRARPTVPFRAPIAYVRTHALTWFIITHQCEKSKKAVYLHRSDSKSSQL